jgi:predicted nucleotidyltransferase
MATTVWLDNATHARLKALKEKSGRTSLGQVIKDLLRTESAAEIFAANEDVIRALCVQFNVVRLRAFGSRARGDAVAESDLDLAIETDTIVNFLGFQEAIGQELAVSTDVVMFASKRPRVSAHIEAEGVEFPIPPSPRSN